jgi:N-carbamoyl-L-amino-acid hydrolase
MWDRDDVVRFTIGMFSVTPNAPSVVPSRVVFSIDLRHPDAATLRQLGDAIPKICQADRGRCEISVKELLHDPPLEFHESIRRTLQSVASALKLPLDVSSGAGHDARYMHYVCHRNDLHPLPEWHQPQ